MKLRSESAATECEADDCGIFSIKTLVASTTPSAAKSGVAPASVVGSGGDITTVGQRICGSMNGCVAVYVHRLDDDDEGDQAHGDHHDK